jgi:PKD repeat protein
MCDTSCSAPISNNLLFIKEMKLSCWDQSYEATSWLWDFGDGNTDTLQNIAHTYLDTGVYKVCLIAYNACGSDTTCVMVYIDCIFLIAGFDFQISKDSVQFFDTTSFTDGWYWDFGDGWVSNLQTPSHTYTDTGSYMVKLYAYSDSLCSDTISKLVTITCDFLSADFSYTIYGDSVEFLDQSVNSTEWFWDFGDTTFSLTQNTFHLYANPDIYTIILAVQYDTLCYDTIADTLSITSTSAGDGLMEISFEVYPNPSFEYLVVQSQNSGTVIIYDSMGKIGLNQEVVMGKTILDISTLNVGAYLLKFISQNRQVYSSKLLISR